MAAQKLGRERDGPGPACFYYTDIEISHCSTNNRDHKVSTLNPTQKLDGWVIAHDQRSFEWYFELDLGEPSRITTNCLNVIHEETGLWRSATGRYHQPLLSVLF